ncbi:hypothetical protein L1286_09280 [Pseudoalteromonas sp. SMS1]|uniref:sensor histidine kinase n=1 Tax=Pseudoalteromonas sp. SMS1 TaxID=2908894 RepID=UPI001F15F9E3|nr:histidine kinase dimerization/phospho-acceptor domain-containing protein [Pseudoalteromonas sp. SMS1]MCF2857662.1 hypothetical protein [Pseudoalteromonas sp. SMS1]
MPSKHQSIIRYLSVRLGLLFVLFILIWTIVAKWVYHYAWDDTTEFYLHQDLELALSGRLAIPYEVDGKYIGTIAHMPQHYRAVIEQTEIPLHHTALFDIQSGDLYVLKEQGVTGQMLYIVHYFSKGDSPSLIPVFMILAGTMLLPLGVVIWRVCTSVSKEADNLIEGIANDDAKSARFAEFVQLATVLKTAQYAQHHALEQERLFAAFLSHEIRTPLTKINHSVSRLQQLDELPFEALAVLDVLEASQDELSRVAQAVLLLSRPNASQLQNLNLNCILVDWRDRWAEHGLKINLNGIDTPAVQAIHLVLFTLLLTQLAKNALQHGRGPLEVTLLKSGLRFENDSVIERSVSGYGLGSKIMKQVCDCFGWDLKISSQHRYTIEIGF